MKTLLYIILFNISAITFAQDPQLFANEWYLQKVIIENLEYFPPNSNALGKAHFENSQISVGNDYCEYGLSGFIEYDAQSIFNFIEAVVYGPTCGDPVVINYAGKHLSIYLGINNIPKNPFTYTIISENGLITLTVINIDNDKAIYTNENLSINDFDNSKISIHPNPAINEVYLSSVNVSGNLKIKIYNIEGQLLNAQNVSFENQASVDVSSLSNGIYFLNIEDINGNTTIKKFIKE